jgi:polysaccharide deacetylase family protein (PEP-CTERM system associated)
LNTLKILWSVDVEDYYMSPESIPESTWDTGRYEDRIEIGSRKLLKLFNEHHIKATWFFLGWVAEKHPELVRAVHKDGHEIGTHTWDHRGVDTLTPEQYKDSLRRSCHCLENITGEKVIGHRAPMWSLKRDMDWAVQILEEAGFLYDSSINPVATYLYGERGAPPACLPPWQKKTTGGNPPVGHSNPG